MKLLTLILLFSSFMFAQLSSETASFESNITNRARGMGEAFTAVANDASTVIWNSAALFQENTMGFGATYTKHFNLIPSYAIYGKFVMDEDYAFGGYIKNDGDDLYSEMEVNVGMAYDLFDLTYIDQLFVGLNFHYRHASWGSENEGLNPVKGSANGFGLDLSMFYKVTKNVNIGFKLNNFIDSFKWNNEDKSGNSNTSTENASRDMNVGIAYQKSKYDNFSIEYRFGFDKHALDRIFLGVEHTLYNVIMLRSGYSRNVMSEHDNTNEKYALGLGISADMIMVNFAYEFNHIQNSYFVGIDVTL
jgi:hypothetical protein